MSIYATLDYLPDLTYEEMGSARSLTFSPSITNNVGWDNTASVTGSESYAALHDKYYFNAIEGSSSFRVELDITGNDG